MTLGLHGLEVDFIESWIGSQVLAIVGFSIIPVTFLGGRRWESHYLLEGKITFSLLFDDLQAIEKLKP